jgi:Family of unknown function (DUF6804)
MAGFSVARLVTASALLIALGRLPYAYYTLTRFLCCLVAEYGAYLAFERKQQPWMWAFGTTALLFNPFAPVRLDKQTWAVLDMVAAGLMLSSLTNRALISEKISDAEANIATRVDGDAQSLTESDTQPPIPFPCFRTNARFDAVRI